MSKDYPINGAIIKSASYIDSTKTLVLKMGSYVYYYKGISKDIFTYMTKNPDDADFLYKEIIKGVYPTSRAMNVGQKSSQLYIGPTTIDVKE